MKRRRLYGAIIVIGILCLFCGIIFYYDNMPDLVPKAEAGKSDVYAKAYAEQIAKGKGTIYADAYAFALENHYGFDNKTMKIFAETYATMRYDGYISEYAVRFAKIYCNLLLVAKESGKDKKFIHQVAAHYIAAEDGFKEYFSGSGAKYPETLS